MDFLKVMNDNPYPHEPAIRDAADLRALGELVGDEDGFGRQLKLIAELKRELAGRVPMITTIFNAWAVLRTLVQPPHQHLPPNMDAAADAPSHWIRETCTHDPQAVRHALSVIGTNLARFAQRCLAAGADGIFLSVRDDWVDTPRQPALYPDLVRPSDLQILQAAGVAPLNILHVCGKAVDFDALAKYPASIINWADRAAGPSIRAAANRTKQALCGGIDNTRTLVTGSANAVAEEVRDAITQAGSRPIIISPGCTFNPDAVPPANLDALTRTVKSYQYPAQT